MRVRASACLFLCCFASATCAWAARAPRRDPPLLFGGAPRPARAPVAIDPALPTGPELVSLQTRPTQTEALCSSRCPVCVQRPQAVATDAAQAALTALELAYERTVGALRSPEPLSDELRGGSDGFDMYLDPAASDVQTWRDAP